MRGRRRHRPRGRPRAYPHPGLTYRRGEWLDTRAEQSSAAMVAKAAGAVYLGKRTSGTSAGPCGEPVTVEVFRSAPFAIERPARGRHGPAAQAAPAVALRPGPFHGIAVHLAFDRAGDLLEEVFFLREFAGDRVAVLLDLETAERGIPRPGEVALLGYCRGRGEDDNEHGQIGTHAFSLTKPNLGVNQPRRP